MAALRRFPEGGPPAAKASGTRKFQAAGSARQLTVRPSPRQTGFPKSARLLRTADYRKVYAEGRRRNLGLLVAFARANGERTSRIGITVSRALGGAVERNRLKRRLREVVRRHRAELGPGWDIVLQPRAAAKTAAFAELEEAIRSFFLVPQRGTSSNPPAESSGRSTTMDS